MAKEKNYFVFFKDIVTAAKNGIMLAADKRKLDGIDDNANNYTHPRSGVAAGTYKKITVDANGHVTGGSNPTTLAGYGITDAAEKNHVHTTIGGHTVNADVPANAKFTDTTYSDATQSASGLLSAADKRKLDGIAENAKNITVDAALNKTSANPVQNKIIATELESLKKSGSDGKKSVAAAVTAMGVPTAADTDFATIVANIKKISTGVDTTDATALAGEILLNKTAYVNERKITGTMPNQGAKTAALNCGGSYTIPAGYHNGAGKVTANSLASQTQATAATGDILSGKTAYVNGAKITGNIASKEAGTYTPGTVDQEIAAGQYLSGKQIIKGDSNLKAENIKKGVNIFGITGNLGGGNTGYAVKDIIYKELKYSVGSYDTWGLNGNVPHIIATSREDLSLCNTEFDVMQKTMAFYDLYHGFFSSTGYLGYIYFDSIYLSGRYTQDQINVVNGVGIHGGTIGSQAVGYDSTNIINIITFYNDFSTMKFEPYSGFKLTDGDGSQTWPNKLYARLIYLDV